MITRLEIVISFTAQEIKGRLVHAQQERFVMYDEHGRTYEGSLDDVDLEKTWDALPADMSHEAATMFCGIIAERCLGELEFGDWFSDRVKEANDEREAAKQAATAGH